MEMGGTQRNVRALEVNCWPFKETSIGKVVLLFGGEKQFNTERRDPSNMM
jgi:hypothetical protein